MSFNSENSLNASHLLPWMVNKLLAKTRKNRKDQNYHDLEERTPNSTTTDSSTRDVPQIEHRRDEDGGIALRISMNTDHQAERRALIPVESGRIKKIPSTTSITRKPIKIYVPTGAERAVSAERPTEVEGSRGAKTTLQRPSRNEASTQEKEFTSADVTERKTFRSSRDISPPRTLLRKDGPGDAEKPGLAHNSKASAAEPSFMIPRKPRHVPRLPSIYEKPYPGISPTQHTAIEESHRRSNRSNDATEWGFLNPEGTSFFHSASNSEYSETSDGREDQNVRNAHADGISDDYIDRILAENGAIGRGGVRSESEFSQTTNGHRVEKMDLPGRNWGIGLGLYEDQSESEYSHSEDEQPVEDYRWEPVQEPVMTMATERVHPEDEGIRLERWKQFFNPESSRSLDYEAALHEQDLLFEQLLKEVQVHVQDPRYRSEATKRAWWSDFRKELGSDNSDEEEATKVPEPVLEPVPVRELSPDLSSRRHREREQHDNRRATMYRATRQRNTLGNEARDTIGSEADLWELETLLKTLQKKRARRRGGKRGESYGGDEVVKEEIGIQANETSLAFKQTR